VRLSAFDAVSGVDSYALRTNGTDWTAWIPFSSAGNYTLPEGDGPKDVLLKVRDRVGNEAQSQVSVILQTSQPTIGVSSPSGGKTVSGKVTVKGTVQSGLAIERMEVSVDGGSWQAASGTGPWSFSLDTSQYANGPHTLNARAVTAAGPSAPQETALKFKNGPAPVSVDALSGLMLGIIVAILLAVFGLAMWAREASRGRRGPEQGAPAAGAAVRESPSNPRPQAAPSSPRQQAAPSEPPVRRTQAQQNDQPPRTERHAAAPPAQERAQPAPAEKAAAAPEPAPEEPEILMTEEPVPAPPPTVPAAEPAGAPEAPKADVNMSLDEIMKKLGH
jgi:hypothetical protein